MKASLCWPLRLLGSLKRVVFFLCFFPQVCAFATPPLYVQLRTEEANEAFFDGNYAEALRLIGDCTAWIQSSSNRLQVANRGVDWTVLEGMLLGLRAEILLAQGESESARSLAQRAAAKLRARRSYYIRNAADPRGVFDFWLYEAFIRRVEGDLYRPIALFDTVLTGQAEKLTRSSQAKAAKGYQDSLRVLEQQASMVLSDTIAEDSNTTFSSYRANRLAVQVMVRLAMVGLRKPGPVTAEDIADASYLLTRADERLQNGWAWKTFVNSDGDLRNLRYDDLKKMAEEGAEAAAQKPDITQADTVLLKQILWHLLVDYAEINTALAECKAHMSLLEPGHFLNPDGADADAPGLFYEQARQMLGSHFEPAHPILRELDFSHAIWFAIQSDAKLLDEKNLGRLVSYARDCVFLAERAIQGRQAGLPLSASEYLEWLCLEQKALRNCIAIHEQRECLSDEQCDEAKARLQTLQAEINACAAAFH